MIPADEILKRMFTFLKNVDSDQDSEETVFGYSVDSFIENTA